MTSRYSLGLGAAFVLSVSFLTACDDPSPAQIQQNVRAVPTVTPPQVCQSGVVEFPENTVSVADSKHLLLRFKNGVVSKKRPHETTEYVRDVLNASSGYPEFQLSLHGKFAPGLGGAMDGIPMMGHYRSEAYNFRKRLALIQLDPAWLPNVLSTEIKDSLAQVLSVQQTVTAESLFDHLKSVDTQFIAIALGQVQDSTLDAPQPAYNLVFHPWLATWEPGRTIVPNLGITMPNFNSPISVGVFGGGIYQAEHTSSAQAPVGSFGIRNVNWHDGAYFSPDNLRLGLVPACGYSRFWVVAVSEDHQHVSFTHFLVANSQDSEQLLSQVFLNSRNLWGSTTPLAFIYGKPGLTQEADRNSVQGWFNTLFRAIGPSN